jgi:hypothetical protein
MYRYDKIIVVTKRTPFQELIERFGTRSQAKFYMEQAVLHAGHTNRVAGAEAPSYTAYERADALYQEAVRHLKDTLAGRGRTQFLDSGYLSTFTFGPTDLVVVIGPDGLVVNTAKYLEEQPILAVNPDPTTIEGILLPFLPETVERGLDALATASGAKIRSLTMAEACLNDGQVLRAVNDLFIGQRTHVSARYGIGFSGQQENHSSSGIIVATGTGSTGWMRSVVTGAFCIGQQMVAREAGGDVKKPDKEDDFYRFDPTSAVLRFAVREPWVSKTTEASIVCGEIRAGQELEIISQMPQNGCIFSDGIEVDYLPFNSGSIARIRVSDRRVALIVP